MKNSQIIKHIEDELNGYTDANKIPNYKRFFKTGYGEYGYGDEFLGIKVPDIRKVVKKYYFDISFDEIKYFLYSKYHEYRMLGVLVLTYQYKSKKITNKDAIYDFYIQHISQVNNWDLVDVTCPHVVGRHLLNKDRTILYNLANSNDLWEKRIAIVSTFAFINAHQFEDTLKIADILLNDTHDLIHKAVGWAIRNVGIKDKDAMKEFLNPRYKTMPRTMLRYAIEKMPEDIRQMYLKGLI
jgi:3-methyladenine DNA glycosylase AlkD